jgi:hypothetical protein
MFVFGRLAGLHARLLAGQLIQLVDQHWQVLRINEDILALEANLVQRNLLFVF